MRAMLLTGFGGPERLRYAEDVPDPEPGDGEVLVRVGAAGLNNTDIWTREGRYGSTDDARAVAGWRREPLTFPRIQGADVSGRIVGVGPGVPEARVGERVVLDPVLYTGDQSHLPPDAGYLGSERDGGFAELVTVPAGNAVPVGDGLGHAELATFPTAYLTAYRMLNRARVGASDSVLVTGASGGVGSALVQLAKLRGCEVIAAVGPGKEGRALELGADATVARDELDLGERRVDVVADVVGGPTFPRMLAALRPGGRYVTAGAIAGPVVEVDLRTVYLAELTLIGSTVATHEEFVEMVALVSTGRLRPLLAATYPLEALPEAQRDFVAKRFFGKLVIEVDPDA